MELKLDRAAIELLYPFFVCLNSQGQVTAFGRSALKCFQNLKEGKHYHEVFLVVAPRALKEHFDSDLIHNKIVNIKSVTTNMSFTGQAIRLDQSNDVFLAITPVLQDTDALGRFQLSYSDFPTYSPVFDFLILTQAERFARKEQTKALNAMEEQHSFAKLNLEIANFCSRCSEIADALDFVNFTLHKSMGWTVRSEKIETNMEDGPIQMSERSAIVPLTVDTVVRYQMHIESDAPLLESEALRIFLASLRFTLESMITRMDQYASIQEAQAMRVNSLKLVTLGEMAAGIAHELNNPLAVIQGLAWITMTKLKSNDLTNEKIEENMGKIVKMTERSSKIINGLRVFARDTNEDPMEKIEISNVIEETLELCRSRIQNRGIRLDIEADGQFHSWGRPIQISQVILNLLNNATDAIEGENDPWIRISVRGINEQWEVSVIDCGKGIPAEIVEKIMSPFFTTKPPGKGTGLGLSIASGILKSHGGDFWYDTSASNTTFRFTLPMTPDL
jgi:C4-dicarboxylate-specific signal transduction histidine kinase